MFWYYNDISEHMVVLHARMHLKKMQYIVQMQSANHVIFHLYGAVKLLSFSCL